MLSTHLPQEGFESQRAKEHGGGLKVRIIACESWDNYLLGTFYHTLIPEGQCLHHGTAPISTDFIVEVKDKSSSPCVYEDKSNARRILPGFL